MEADSDAESTIIAQDRKWLASHQAELWASARQGYAMHGRGAVLVLFTPVGHGEIVVAYTDRPNWPSSDLTAQLAHYNPATHMVVVCLGQLGDATVVVGPRAYLMQYLTPAA
jgi:hypothetical protein